MKRGSWLSPTRYCHSKRLHLCRLATFPRRVTSACGKGGRLVYQPRPRVEITMKSFASRSLIACGRVCVTIQAILILSVCLGSNSRAQESNDVHVVPKRGADSQQEHLARDMRTGLFSVQVDLVLVPVTVTDSLNRPVTGLTKNLFSLYEDEKPQKIQYFSTEDTPISVGILLDVSGTMSNKIDAAREALSDFFAASHPDDDYFVITFADRPKVLSDATKSIGDIQGRLATIKPFGYTALLDAVDMGLKKLRSARYQRRALLIISDGGDNASRHRLPDVKSSVEESGVEVYALGLFDDGLPFVKSLDEKLGKRILTQVTEASGGRLITVDNLAKLSATAASISSQMRTQYLLGYRPANPVRDGKWRKIKIRVASALAGGDAGVRLHPAYKKGYMAPPR